MKKINRKAVIMTCIFALCIGGCGSAKKTEAPAEPEEKEAELPSEQSTEETEKASARQTEELWNSSRIREISGDFREHFNEITIEGTAFSIPISYKELEALGFHLESSQKDVTSEGSPVTGYSSWGEDQEGIFCMDYRFKGKGERIPLTECDAVSFLWDVDAAQGIDVAFYGGISAGSTREEVAAILDEVYVDEWGAQYMVELDEDGYAKLAAYFDGDRLAMIELFNYTDYVN